MDVPALNPQPIERGMVLAHPDGYRILHGSQTALIAAIRSGIGQPQDIARLMRWSEPLRKSRERLLAAADMTLQESLDRHGISGPDPRGGAPAVLPAGLRRRGPADVVPVRHAQHAGAAEGLPALPALGMQALPNQLALGLEQPVEHGIDVLGVTRSTGEGRPHPHRRRRDPGPRRRGGDRPDDGLGTARPRHPAMRGLSTWWFATEFPRRR